jgi:pentatricopeptide repeat protein
LFLSGFDKRSLIDYELAVSLLRNSTNRHAARNDDDDYHHGHSHREDSHWTLAPPNVYMYSAVMAIGARQRQYSRTIQLLEEYETLHPSSTPNLYSYNSALQSLTVITPQQQQQQQQRLGRTNHSLKQRKLHIMDKTNERVRIAFHLYNRLTMTKIHPDIVTYNTLLSVLIGRNQHDETDWKHLYEAQLTPNRTQGYQHIETDAIHRGESSSLLYYERVITAILDRMILGNVNRDTITYKNAIRCLAVGQSNCTSAILRLMQRATMDQKQSAQRYRICMMEVHNEALSCFAEMGNVIGIIRIVSMIMEQRLECNSQSWIHILWGLGNAGMTSSIPAILSTSVSDECEIYVASKQCGLEWNKCKIPSLDANHFSIAILCCLKRGDFESAGHILSHMRSSGIRPTQETLTDISRLYAVTALEYSSNKTAPTTTATVSNHPAVLRARSSYTILSSIDNPPHPLVSMVYRACCSAGMFLEAQRLLRSLHQQALQIKWDEYEIKSNNGQSFTSFNDMAHILLPLHQDRLRYCAHQGNVNNALSLCEDIQYISNRLMIHLKNHQELDTLNVTATIHRHVPVQETMLPTKIFIGMTPSCWKSLLIAASKSGHWKVCLSTLQFLRPNLEATRTLDTSSKSDIACHVTSYGQFETAMNTVVHCLAVRSQYGWIVCVIDDWIEWSGRRPPRDAVVSAIRVLATRGRGEEVSNLLTQCTSIPSSNTKYDDKMYNSMLFVGAITSLYNEGLYDEADDAFVMAIARQALPFHFEQETVGTAKHTTLDLHGMNLAVAHSAVRIALQQLAVSVDNWNRTANDDVFENDMIIITGRGLNSALRMRPVIRPVVQRMLVEEFYPPFSTISVPGNMGAIRVASNDIKQWLDHREQKGARLTNGDAQKYCVTRWSSSYRIGASESGTSTKRMNNVVSW